MSKNVKIKICLLVFLFTFFSYGCTKVGVKKIEVENTNQTTPQPQISVEDVAHRFLDGKLVPVGQEKFLPIALVIDNLPNFSSLTGLGSASLIYEIPVEGGWTRLLAFFDYHDLPTRIGPIRSARPAFAEIAEEYKAVFVHAGGSPDVLEKIKKGLYQIYNLDEISWQGFYFKRDYNLSSPHNLFIEKESLEKFINDRQINLTADFTPWLFDESGLESTSGLEANEIKINFSSLYQLTWQYQPETEDYLAWQNNKPIQVLNGIKNIILQYTEIITRLFIG
jgi:hypothetical protein